MSVQKVDKTTGNTTLIAGATLWADMPIGTVIGSFSETAPSGFLYCDDTAYSASSYPELWAILPSTVKDTTNNTFTIDLCESTLKGVGENPNGASHVKSGGLALGEFIDDRVQTHNHALGLSTTTGSNNNTLPNMTIASGGNTAGAVTTYLNTYSQGRYGATTEVKSTGVRWYIKAKQVALPADLESAVEDAVEEVYGDIIPSSASSSNKVLVNSDKTSAVTSGSTAPITSGGVWDVAKDVIGIMSESDKKWEGHIPYYGTRRFIVSIYTSSTAGVYDFYYRPYNDLKKVTYIAGDNQSPTFNVTSLGNDNYSITATVSGQTVTTAYFI